MRDPLKPADIDCDELAVPVRPRSSLKDVTYAAEVAFAFFTNIGNRDDGFSKAQIGLAGSAKRPEQSHQSATVVGDAGYAQCFVFSAKLKRRFPRENGVQMRGDDEGPATE